MLTAADKHHWAPTAVTPWLAGSFGDPGARILEIGPGHVPFSRATHFVEFDTSRIEDKPNWFRCDVANEPLPFENKSFDFVYARHVCEDMFNPFALCAEMQRVARAGYIETPSPIAELCRGVDGNAPPYRGYHHHRYVAWTHAGELRFVSKYALVEYLQFDEERLALLLRQGPKYWNTYHLWNGTINVVHRQSPVDFDIPRDYRMMLDDAVKQSIVSTDVFWKQVAPETVAAPKQAFA